MIPFNQIFLIFLQNVNRNLLLLLHHLSQLFVVSHPSPILLLNSITYYLPHPLRLPLLHLHTHNYRNKIVIPSKDRLDKYF